MPAIGTTELMIILVIVVLLFGVGRISKIASEMGKGMRDFRNAFKDTHVIEETIEKKE